MRTAWIGLPLLMAARAAIASVGPEVAAQLQGRLTPLGAEPAGNADGSIPGWDGGLTPDRVPAGFSAGNRYSDPYADEKPVLVITADNAAKQAAHLSPGQRALLAAYPASYRLPVYPGHRSYAAPNDWYAGSFQNATQAYLDKPDGTPQHAGAGIPFPIPQDGNEAIWNHRLSWRGPGRQRAFCTGSVAPDGTTELVHYVELVRYQALDAEPEKKYGRILGFSILAALSPDKLRGAVKLIYDTAAAMPGSAWQFSPGQSFMSHTSEAGGDTPALGMDGLMNDDQVDGYSGPSERYDWKLRGKSEIYVPYNAYRLHDSAFDYPQLLSPHHLNPDAARYELHRVWVLEGRCRRDRSCAYPRRVLYLDEDSWRVLLAELYDHVDRLAGFQEVHTFMAYDSGVLAPALETVYDLAAGRYLVTGMNNQESEMSFPSPERDQFYPSAARHWAWKAGAKPR